MPTHNYDLFVIGAGSGGVRAARMAAGMGAKVAIAEDRYMGGTCVNVGCVPKKLYVYASEYGRGFADARGFGWQADNVRFDWSTLRDNKKSEIARLNTIYQRLLDGAGAEIIDGRAAVVDPHTVSVEGQHFTADRILVATGGWPYVPEFPGSELALTSNEIFDLPSFPKRIVVVGGGYIAVEFAGIFNGLGAEVVQLYRGEMFLRGFDEDVRHHAAKEIAASGVDLRFNTNVTSITKSGNALLVTLTDGSTLETDAVLYATGRKANIEGLGLQDCGVALTPSGAIAVDEHFRTSVPSIFALGDVVGRMELTPVALAEGMSFVRREFANIDRPVDYEFIPTAVFCQPLIGTVGFTEAGAREEFGEIDVYRTAFKPMRHTISGREERTLMKLLVDKASNRVVGAHMVGPDAGEIIQGIAIAMKAGATKAHFDATIGIHPTAAEEFVTMREPVPPV